MSETLLLDNDGICAYFIEGARMWLDSTDVEMQPMCVKQHRDDGAIHMSVLAFDISDNHALAQGMIAGIAGPLHLLAFSSDSYYEIVRQEELETRDTTKSLQERFEAGDTSIKEAVNSVVLFADERMLQISQPYTRNTETGRIEWDEPKIGQDTEGIQGRVPDVRRKVMEITKMVESYLTDEVSPPS